MHLPLGGKVNRALLAYPETALGLSHLLLYLLPLRKSKAGFAGSLAAGRDEDPLGKHTLLCQVVGVVRVTGKEV